MSLPRSLPGHSSAVADRSIGALFGVLVFSGCGGEGDSTRLLDQVETLQPGANDLGASAGTGGASGASVSVGTAGSAGASVGGSSKADSAGSGGQQTSGSELQPMYLLHSAVQTDDGRVNYFTAVSSLTEERTIDYAGSIEVPGRARLYADRASGTLLIGDGESVTLQSYRLSDAGGLVPGERLSLQGEGVTSLGAQALAIVGPTKAYYKDNGQGQVVVINPQAMTVDAVLPLPEELLRDDAVASVSDWAVRGSDAFFAVGWTTADYDRAFPGAVLVHIDTETNTLTTHRDERCRELITAANVDGTLYFFSGVINGFGHAVHAEEGGQPDCVLRVLPGETQFDASAIGTLSKALPAGHSPTAASVSEEGVVWANVADLDLAATAPGSTDSEWYRGGWSWWSIPLEEGSATTAGQGQKVDLDPGAYSTIALSLDGAFLISQAEADYSLSTLVELASGQPQRGISFPGFTFGRCAVAIARPTRKQNPSGLQAGSYRPGTHRNERVDKPQKQV